MINRRRIGNVINDQLIKSFIYAVNNDVFSMLIKAHGTKT